MIIITDILNEPFDEGAKIATRNLIRCIKEINSAFVFSINSQPKLSFVDRHIHLNKLLFNLTFYKFIRKQNSTILYIPEASITFFSFIRAKSLNIFTGSDVFILSLQPRVYSFLEKVIIKIIPPSCVISQSQKTAKVLSSLGIKNRSLPLGVDSNKYCQFAPARKKELRDKFEIASGKVVLLHVGHIQKTRNLEWLINVKAACLNVEIIIVGSNYNQDDDYLYNALLKSDIKIIQEYTPDMEEIYNLADYYVFPVLKNDGAIETPLSVLEAMACNLPIITSRFGSLPDVFKEDNDFHYIRSWEEILEIIKIEKSNLCKNREKVGPYTWKRIAQQLISMLG